MPGPVVEMGAIARYTARSIKFLVFTYHAFLIGFEAAYRDEQTKHWTINMINQKPYVTRGMMRSEKRQKVRIMTVQVPNALFTF